MLDSVPPQLKSPKMVAAVASSCYRYPTTNGDIVKRRLEQFERGCSDSCLLMKKCRIHHRGRSADTISTYRNRNMNEAQRLVRYRSSSSSLVSLDSGVSSVNTSSEDLRASPLLRSSSGDRIPRSKSRNSSSNSIQSFNEKKTESVDCLKSSKSAIENSDATIFGDSKYTEKDIAIIQQPYSLPDLLPSPSPPPLPPKSRPPLPPRKRSEIVSSRTSEESQSVDPVPCTPFVALPISAPVRSPLQKFLSEVSTALKKDMVIEAEAHDTSWSTTLGLSPVYSVTASVPNYHLATEEPTQDSLNQWTQVQVKSYKRQLISSIKLFISKQLKLFQNLLINRSSFVRENTHMSHIGKRARSANRSTSLEIFKIHRIVLHLIRQSCALFTKLFAYSGQFMLWVICLSNSFFSLNFVTLNYCYIAYSKIP